MAFELQCKMSCFVMQKGRVAVSEQFRCDDEFP